MSIPSLPVVLLAGAGIGAGTCLLVDAVTARPRVAARSTRLRAHLRGFAARIRVSGSRQLQAGGVGLLTWMVTGWPVAAAAAAAAALGATRISGGAAAAQASITRLEAFARWIETLRDTVAGGVGLEQAISLSAATAGPAIAPALAGLAGRLRDREPMAAALHRFADELADADADAVLAALVVAADARGPGLAAVLRDLADQAREQVAMRRRTEATRRAPRRGTRYILGIFALIAGGLLLLNRSFLSFYDSTLGQLALLMVLAIVAGGLSWQRQLSLVEVFRRFLATDARSPSAIGRSS